MKHSIGARAIFESGLVAAVFSVLAALSTLSALSALSVVAAVVVFRSCQWIHVSSDFTVHRVSVLHCVCTFDHPCSDDDGA